MPARFHRKLQLVCLLVSLLFAVVAIAQTEDFTIVVLPDPQFYSASYPAIFNSQTRWIADNRQALNIKLVLGEGDLVDQGSSIAQWQNADAAVRTLDAAGIPYFWAIGNNDYQTISTRLATNYNSYFGASRYSQYAWFRGNETDGSYPAGSTENYYGVVTIGGKEYLVLVLEFMPRPEAMAWAARLLARPENASRELILLTHSYMTTDNTRIDACDTAYTTMGASGEDIWYKLFITQPNLSLVVNGHTSTAGRRADLGTAGNLVNQMLADYQTSTNGGNGYLRILSVKPSLNQIAVTTYSPYLGTYQTDAKNKFTLTYHSTGPLGTSSTIIGHVKIARLGSSQDCNPLSGATITAGTASATADSTGNYSLPNLAPGTYSVTATAKNFAKATLSTPAWGGYSSQLEFFLVPATGTLSGTVRDAKGKAIASAAVSISGGIIKISQQTRTNSAGYYSFTKVGIGSYTVTVTKTPYASQTISAVVNEESVSTADVAMKR